MKQPILNIHIFKVVLLLLAWLVAPHDLWAEDFSWPDAPSARYGDVSRFTVSVVDGQTVLTGHCLANTEFSFKLQTSSGYDASATYSSSNTDVVALNTNSYTNGIEELVVKGAGTATITATLTGDYTPKTYSYTLTITAIDTDYGVSVWGTEVTSGNCDNILYGDDTNDGKVTFDESTHTLIFNNAEIPDYQEIGAVQFSGDNLNVRLVGANTIYNGFEHYGSGDNATVTFFSDGGENNRLVFWGSNDADDVLNMFSDCSIANPLSESSEWTIASVALDPDYPDYKTAFLYKRIITNYDITVAGVQVTDANAEDVLGDGKVSYDHETQTLTISEIYYTPDDDTPFVTSSLDALTVKMEGTTSIYSEAEVTAAFVSTNADAVLTFTTEEHDRLQLLNSQSIELASGFSSIAFTGYLYRELNMVKNLLAPSPSMYDAYLEVFRAGYEPEGTTFNYEIDYVDDALEDATGTYDPTQTAEENQITLAGPCVVTVYAQYGTVKSAEKEGRYFGYAQSVLNVPIGTTEVELPAIVPATGDDIEIGYEGLVPDEYNKVDVSDVTDFGETMVFAYFSSTDTTPYTVLNDNAQLTINIVPVAPSASPEEGTFNETQYVTLTPNLPEGKNGFIHYKRIVDGEERTDSTYSVPLTIDESTTLTFYQEAFDSDGFPYYSETVSVTYTILPKTELNISFAQNSREWASFCADADLETPAGLQAYVVTDVQENGVSVSAISYIPQGTGILLKRTTESVEEPIMAKVYMEDGPQTEMPDNLLAGTAESKSVKSLQGTVYVLYNDGFTRATSGSIPAHRAYLTLGSGMGQAVGSRLLIWEDYEMTGVATIPVDSVITPSVFYNLNGQRVSKPSRGLYIYNGKKQIVK